MAVLRRPRVQARRGARQRCPSRTAGQTAWEVSVLLLPLVGEPPFSESLDAPEPHLAPLRAFFRMPMCGPKKPGRCAAGSRGS